MPTACRACPLRRLASFRKFTTEELKFVEWFKTGELTFDPGGMILREGEANEHLFTLLSGWAFRYRLLEDGRRQILSFALPGDLLGMQGPVLKEMQHSVEALTPVVLCTLPRERLWKLYRQHPELAHDLVWLATRGERMVDAHLLAVGRRSAVERVAYLLLHLFDRSKSIGATRGHLMPLPITQKHISDALGLSIVHTNRSIRALVNRGWIARAPGQIEIRNRAALVDLAMYDESDGAPRPII